MAGLLCSAYLAFGEGKRKAGRKLLTQALALGRRQNIITLDLCLPQQLQSLCAEALRADIEQNYTQRLIAAHGLSPEGIDLAQAFWRCLGTGLPMLAYP